MTNPFAALETAVNVGTLAALNNATATIAGASVSGVFDNGPRLALGMVAGTGPRFTALSSDLSDLAIGDAITIGDVAYTAAEIEIDGTGMTHVILQAA